MYERLLVPLDGSLQAENVLPYVEELARRLGSEVILLTACRPNEPLDRPLRAYLERRASELQSLEVKASALVVQGDPAEEILTFSEQNDIGLIAISAYGRSSSGRWNLGSVANKVLQRAHVPILLTRASSLDEALSQREMSRVLVPLDGSPLAERVLPYVEGLAKGADSEVILLRVLDPFVLPGYVEAFVESVLEAEERKDWKQKREQERQEEAKAYLSRLGDELRGKGLKVAEVLKVGEAAEGILEYAEANSASLIVLSSHGRSGITRWVYGSVAAKVIEGSTKPIFLLRVGSRL